MLRPNAATTSLTFLAESVLLPTAAESRAQGLRLGGGRTSVRSRVEPVEARPAGHAAILGGQPNAVVIALRTMFCGFYRNDVLRILN